MNMDFRRRMPTPEEIKALYPLSLEMKRQKQRNDEEIKNILTGKSDKFLLIIGPCSADREDAVIDYIERLRKIWEKVKDKIVIVPRLYTSKPRTTGDGYKGMMHQPDPNSTPDMAKGLAAIRKLHIDVLERTGFSCADELLYAEKHIYLSDCMSYAAVGARSVEDQMHRLTASGLDIPVGMKNPTSGELTAMMNAIHAAQNPHTFVYSGYEVVSKGNPLAHAILRGSSLDGRNLPNYRYEDLQHLCELYAETDLKNPAVIIDTNHSNSGKNPLEQPRIAREVIYSMKHSRDIKKLVKGLMTESYILDGNQCENGAEYGKSITDACLGIEKTEAMIYEIAESL